MTQTPLSKTKTVGYFLPHFTPGTHRCYSWVSCFPRWYQAHLNRWVNWSNLSKVSCSRRQQQQWSGHEPGTFRLTGQCSNHFTILSHKHTHTHTHTHKAKPMSAMRNICYWIWEKHPYCMSASGNLYKWSRVQMDSLGMSVSGCTTVVLNKVVCCTFPLV